jgi:molecular chaperone HtpG
MAVDAPVQMYALLFIPTSPERGLLSSRKENGLKLYARKVLIDEYYKNLLPEYLAFVEGVVDSEDIPLNVSRESVQANRIIATLKKLITSKVLDMLKKMADEEKEKYITFWENFADYIKQGVALEQKEPEALYPLLRFHTNKQPDTLSSLDDYVSRMKPDQKEIYYIIGDDKASVLYSPHLDIVNQYDYEVLLLTSPSDAFMLTRLHEYKDHKLANVATADLPVPEKEKTSEEETKTEEKDYTALIDLFKKQLGEKVVDVRATDRLSDSPARLVDPEGALPQEMQKVYKLLDKDFETPKKILEVNPDHPILKALKSQPENSDLTPLTIEQIYEDALLIEGLHPDPASMINRIQKILEAALV